MGSIGSRRGGALTRRMQTPGGEEACQPRASIPPGRLRFGAKVEQKSGHQVLSTPGTEQKIPGGAGTPEVPMREGARRNQVRGTVFRESRRSLERTRIDLRERENESGGGLWAGPAWFKSLMQGRAAAERTAAVAAARLPAPEHARQPPRSPQPRRPASCRQVSQGSCEGAGGRGWEAGEQSPAGLASQTVWQGRGCHASGARPPGSPRRPLARAGRHQPLLSGPEP